MNIGQQVYITIPKSNKVSRGVIVGKKWRLLPRAGMYYIVNEVKGSPSVVNALVEAFRGSAPSLLNCSARQLIPVPEISEQ